MHDLGIAPQGMGVVGLVMRVVVGVIMGVSMRVSMACGEAE